jgi:hypothetical protein
MPSRSDPPAKLTRCTENADGPSFIRPLHGDAGGAQAGHKGGGFPVTVGHRRQQTQAAGTPAKPPRHVGGRRGLVEEHQTFRVECGLAPDEGVAGLGHVRTLLLGGVQTFF